MAKTRCFKPRGVVDLERFRFRELPPTTVIGVQKVRAIGCSQVTANQETWQTERHRETQRQPNTPSIHYLSMTYNITKNEQMTPLVSEAVCGSRRGEGREYM